MPVVTKGVRLCVCVMWLHAQRHVSLIARKTDIGTPHSTQFVLANISVQVSIQKHWNNHFWQHKNDYFARSTEVFTILDLKF